MPILDRRPAFWGTDKPATDQVEVEANGPLGLSLQLVCLFGAAADGYADIADPARTFLHNGAVNRSDGLFGGQVTTSQTGTTAAAYSPYIGLSPTEEQADRYTVSALVNFDGSIPSPGAYNTLGYALCSDGAGRFPIMSYGGSGSPYESFQVSEPGGSGNYYRDANGALFSPSSLTGWHRLTAVCDGTTTTLYIDGGRTFTGTTSFAQTRFGLATLLGGGSSVQPGTCWPWPTADVFFWSRALSANEVSGHSGAPWHSTLRPLYGITWEAIPGGVVTPPPPPPPPGTEPTLAGKGAVRADAALQTQGIVSGSSAIGLFAIGYGAIGGNGAWIAATGTGFLRAEAVWRSHGTAHLSGAVVVSADASSTMVRANISGAAGITGTARRLVSASGTISAIGTASGTPLARSLGLSVVLGGGTATGTPVWVENQLSAHAIINGIAGASSPVGRALRGASAIVSAVASTAADVSLTKGAEHAKVSAHGAVYASPAILLRPKVLPGRGTGAMPAFWAVEIETFVPGIKAVVSSEGHGTRAHGTLSQATQGAPELTSIIRASDMGYRTRQSDSGGLVSYPPLLDQAFQINTQLNLDPAQSAAGASWGTLLLINLPNFWLDQISGSQNCDGRSLTIMRGVKGWDMARQYVTDPPKSSLTPAFIGLGTAWTMDERELSIPLRDATYFLEPSMPMTLYGGVGGLDGTQTLAQKPYPYCRGGSTTNPISNVSPVLVDPAALIYQYNGGPGQVIALYEGGFSGTGGITYAGDVGNLYAGSAAPGTYRTNNAKGLFQLGSNPVNTITVDVIGGFATVGILQPPNPIGVVRHILTEDIALPPTMLDMNSFIAAETATLGMEAGLYFDGGTTAPTGLAVVSAILAGLGANIVPTRNGTLRLLLLRTVGPTEPITEVLDEHIIVSLTPKPLPASLYPPRYRAKIGYRHNFTVQTSGLNMTKTPLARQQYLATTDQFAGWASTDVLRAYRRPNDPGEVPTALLRQQDAQQIANDLGALWGVRRRLFGVSVPIGNFNRDIGDVVRLKYPLEDLRSGQLGRVVGYSLSSSDAAVTYSVLV